VLNLLLLARGERLFFVESSFLQHIGGISLYIAYKNQLLPKRILMKLKRISGQVKLKSRQWIITLAGTHLRTQNLALVDAELVKFHAGRGKEHTTCRYFTQVLQSLAENRPLPVAPDADEPEMAKRIKSVTGNIVSLYEEFREQLG
jgi:hypothetical protein